LRYVFLVVCRSSDAPQAMQRLQQQQRQHIINILLNLRTLLIYSLGSVLSVACRSTEALEAMQCLQQQQLILSNPEYQSDAASLGDVIRGTASGVATPWDMLRRWVRVWMCVDVCEREGGCCCSSAWCTAAEIRHCQQQQQETQENEPYVSSSGIATPWDMLRRWRYASGRAWL
jgi:hypothetical protein